MQGTRERLLDLEQLAHKGTPEKQSELLDRVTDLFFVTSGHQSAEDTEVFGDIMERIAFELEVEARARLSERFASVENAPRNLIRRLATDEIDVARPVLENSPCLSEDDLVDIASSEDQAHLHAISNRKQLSSSVTDVIVERGDDEVLASVASNGGAKFSEDGMQKLSRRAGDNTELMTALEVREDVPVELIEEIKHTVAARLRKELADSHPELDATDLASLVESKAADLDIESCRRSSRIFETLTHRKEINQNLLVTFSRMRRLPETVHCLAVMTGLDVGVVAHCLLKADLAALAVLCKANDFENSTFAAMLQLRTSSRPLAAKAIADAMRHYDAMDRESALRTIASVRQRFAAQSQQLAAG